MKKISESQIENLVKNKFITVRKIENNNMDFQALQCDASELFSREIQSKVGDDVGYSYILEIHNFSYGCYIRGGHVTKSKPIIQSPVNPNWKCWFLNSSKSYEEMKREFEEIIKKFPELGKKIKEKIEEYSKSNDYTFEYAKDLVAYKNSNQRFADVGGAYYQILYNPDNLIPVFTDNGIPFARWDDEGNDEGFMCIHLWSGRPYVSLNHGGFIRQNEINLSPKEIADNIMEEIDEGSLSLH